VPPPRFSSEIVWPLLRLTMSWLPVVVCAVPFASRTAS
jgi:hypothetical protein